MVDRAIIIGRTKLESAFALHFYVFPEYAAVKPLAIIYDLLVFVDVYSHLMICIGKTIAPGFVNMPSFPLTESICDIEKLKQDNESEKK